MTMERDELFLERDGGQRQKSKQHQIQSYSPEVSPMSRESSRRLSDQYYGVAYSSYPPTAQEYEQVNTHRNGYHNPDVQSRTQPTQNFVSGIQQRVESGKLPAEGLGGASSADAFGDPGKSGGDAETTSPQPWIIGSFARSNKRISSRRAAAVREVRNNNERYQSSKPEQILGTGFDTLPDLESGVAQSGTRAGAMQPPSPRSQRLALASHPVNDDSPDGGTAATSATKPRKRVRYLLSPLTGPKSTGLSSPAPRSPFPFTLGRRSRKSALRDKNDAPRTIKVLHRCNNGRALAVTDLLILAPNAQSRSTTGQQCTPDATPMDDEALFRSLHSKIVELKGGRLAWLLHRLLGLRTLQSLRLVQYSRRTDVISCDGTLPYEAEAFSSRLAMRYLDKPKLGRDRMEWVNWAFRLPRLSAVSDSPDADLQEVALELVHGWAVFRIAIAWLLVLIVAIASGSVWVIFGLERDGGEGLKRAGGRVQTGVVLAETVAVLGWGMLTGWGATCWLLD
ncbi:MAG: hypothetical protein M1825_001607 [Sarcosagium campestre]|nr:MAG: hypothetical protein M1825_001607 [Sarcosagium campestre]